VECQTCGRDFQKLNKIEIEGTIVSVCDKCIKFGRVIETKIDYQEIKRYVSIKPLIENNTKFVSNYGVLIKKTREARGLTIEDLAKQIKERKSVIARVENEDMNPDDELTKRLENFLKIRLTEDYEKN
jgi:putative transcription factor